MANEYHLELLMMGSFHWNVWRVHHQEVQPDLSGVELSFANLGGINFNGVNLRGAHLNRVNLSQADLSFANLRGAHLNRVDFTGANLNQADLSFSDLIASNLSFSNLSQADLSQADLSVANFNGANFGGANLTKAITLFTIFVNVDLSNIKGLTTVEHKGPSSISINTLYRSGGKIPDSFLQGTGVPDTFLDYIRSLRGKNIQYFTCFISHSNKDRRFCDRLYADLLRHDVSSWYFPEDAIWGKPAWEEIDRSIKQYDKLVVVCSAHSLQSGPVLREIERALQREDRERKHILFPLRLDNYLFKGWEHERKADVTSRVAGDFRGWNRSAAKYETAMRKFLNALKTQDEAIH